MIVSRGENKNILYFLANLSGDPIYINRYTEGILYKSYKSTNMFDIFTSDFMFKSSIDGFKARFIDTYIEGYRKGMVALVGTGFSRHYEVILIADGVYELTKQQVDKMEAVFSTLSRGTDHRMSVNVGEVINEAYLYAVRSSHSMKNKLVLEWEDDKYMKIDTYYGKIIISCALSILHEMGAVGDIKVSSLQDDPYGEKLIFRARSKNKTDVDGIYNLCKEYPETSTACMFTRVICNEKGVEFLVKKNGNDIEISLMFPHGSFAEFSVFNHYRQENTKFYK